MLTLKLAEITIHTKYKVLPLPQALSGEDGLANPSEKRTISTKSIAEGI